MKPEQFVPLNTIVDALERLGVQGATGTLFIGARTNQNAQVALRNGKVEFVYYQGKRGREALALLASLDEGRYQFRPGILTPHAESLPSTAKIVQGFRLASRPKPDAAAAHRRIRAGDVATPRTPVFRQRKLLTELLTEYIGPTAPGLVTQQVIQQGNMMVVIATLAGEIPSEEDAADFRKKAIAICTQDG